MYNAIRNAVPSNHATKKYLERLGLKIHNYFSSNLSELQKYLKAKFPGLKPEMITTESLPRMLFETTPEPIPDPPVKTTTLAEKHHNNELMEAIKKPREYQEIAKDTILIQAPNDPERYEVEKQFAQRQIENATKSNGTITNVDLEPYTIYYSNYVRSINDVFAGLDAVCNNFPWPFKLHFSFGCIYEHAEPDGTYKYNFINANPTLMKRSIPVVITSPADIANYKIYISNLIEEARDATFLESSYKWISVVNVMFACYKLTSATGKINFLPEPLLKNTSLCTYNEDNNLCWWAAYAAHLRVQQTKQLREETATKVKQEALSIRSLTRDAKIELRKWLKEIKHVEDYKIESTIKHYKGFDSTDYQLFSDWANVNTVIYDYEETNNSYSVWRTITPNDTSKNPIDFPILLIASDDKIHVMFIKRPDEITGILICPKCHSYCFNRHAPSADRKRFDNHVAKCTGKIIKKVRLDTTPHPYCPHLWKTTYGQLLSCQEQQYWQPTRYFMTYDFETMEESMKRKLTDKMEIDSVLHPLSVSITVYDNKGMRTFWFSRKTMSEEEFIKAFISKMFEEYDSVYEANTIRTPTQVIKPKHVMVLGYNSGRFDMNLLLPYLNTDTWKVSSVIGSMSHFKALSLQQINKTNETERILCFADAMSYVTPQPLREFIENFGDSGDMTKAYFPYEVLNVENFNMVLNQKSPFRRSEFTSALQGTQISVEEYTAYLKDAERFNTRWEYLEFYNRRDTEAMISPLRNLIERTATYKVDMLSNLSLSANSSNTKYAMAYADFDPYKNYAHQQETTFQPTKQWWYTKVRSYVEQDKSKGRDTKDNVFDDDYDYFYHKFSTETCYLCKEGFTRDNQPTLDRIDNSKPHTRDNVKICCKYCNMIKSERPENEARLYIQLKKYCLNHNLPMTIVDENVYHVLRAGITGGMSNVLHRLNIKGTTPITKLVYDGEIHSVPSDRMMTHVTGIDFNSLYPSVYSSIKHPFIPYTDGKMYMPGSVQQSFKSTGAVLRNKAYAIINGRKELFVASIKGHIPTEYYNEFINLPPIWRNIDITTNEETIGSTMYKYMVDNNLAVDQKQRKLTMLLSTHPSVENKNKPDPEDSTAELIPPGYMLFSSYYLWFLMDTCHFVIEDIRYIVTFTKHEGFQPFVKTFMENRQQAIKDNNRGLDLFCKISLNGSYGYDGMNAEKWTKSKIVNKQHTLKSQLRDTFISTRKIADDSYIVESESKVFGCTTCIQEAFFTLDNAKYWYLNFVYNFMYKAFDMDRIHFIEGDTDSMYWAIAGDPTRDCHQGFEAVIKDKAFYDKNAKYFFATTDAIADKKKLLGLSIEKEGDNCIALAPKCYTIWTDDEVQPVALKVKGVKKDANKLTYNDYVDVLMSGSIKGAVNTNLQVKDGVMSKIIVYKNALTCVHSKMKVLPDQSCAPFI